MEEKVNAASQPSFTLSEYVSTKTGKKHHVLTGDTKEYKDKLTAIRHSVGGIVFCSSLDGSQLGEGKYAKGWVVTDKALDEVRKFIADPDGYSAPVKKTKKRKKRDGKSDKEDTKRLIKEAIKEFLKDK